MKPRVLQYRVSRFLGRLITRTCAVLTLERMPPFVSTSGVVVRGDQVLMVMDPIRREPILPGGHLKWRETPLRALVREVREETGFVIFPKDVIGVYGAEDLLGEEGVVRVIYDAEVSGGQLASSPEGEALWMPLGDALVSSRRDAPILQEWLDRADRQSYSS